MMGRKKQVIYKRIFIFDEKGYGHCDTSPPDEFDLCELMREDGRKLMGWRSGNEYCGLRIKDGDVFTKWKRACNV